VRIDLARPFALGIDFMSLRADNEHGRCAIAQGLALFGSIFFLFASWYDLDVVFCLRNPNVPYSKDRPFMPNSTVNHLIQRNGSPAVQRCYQLLSDASLRVNWAANGGEIQAATLESLEPTIAIFNMILTDTSAKSLVGRIGPIATCSVMIVVAGGMELNSAVRLAVDHDVMVLPEESEDTEIWDILTKGATRATHKASFQRARRILVERFQHCSPEELSVLRQWASGLDNKSIADKLGVAQRTLYLRKNSLLAKLECDSIFTAINLINRYQLTEYIDIEAVKLV
jgi:FixJ family two-component response regulator